LPPKLRKTPRVTQEELLFVSRSRSFYKRDDGGEKWNLRNTTTLMAFKIRLHGETATVSKKALLVPVEEVPGRQDPVNTPP
jgi:hypothetical protein